MATALASGTNKEGKYTIGYWSFSYDVVRNNNDVTYYLYASNTVAEGISDTYGAATVTWTVNGVTGTGSIPNHSKTSSVTVAVTIKGGSATAGTVPATYAMSNWASGNANVTFPAGGGHTVYFNGNGGNPSESSRTVYYGGTYGTMPSATRAYYTPNGWFTETTGGSRIYSTTTVTLSTDQNLYVQWTPNTYTVSYYANDGSGRTASQSFQYGNSVSISQGFTRDKYIFLGWNTKADGSGTSYQPNTSYSSPANLTLYAQWKKANIPVYVRDGTTVRQVEKAYVRANGVVKECTVYARVNGQVKIIS